MQLPLELKPHTQNQYQLLVERYPFILSWDEELTQQLYYVIGLSKFCHDTLMRDEELCKNLPTLMASQDRSCCYREELQVQLSQQDNEDSGMAFLRRYRNREMLYIAWNDFVSSANELEHWSLEISLNHISELAEAMIFETYQWQYRLCCNEYGTPCNQQGEAQPMLIIGMGKLGGGELNFSSDIDLIFAYPENGETQGARRSISNPQFFTRLGQRIIKSLDKWTVDGFCYRVDMRLRPFGESGPLVMSFTAMEDYYQEQGRDWERYAMVKARVMGREMYSHYQELRQTLRPFVFRRYIDFSAIQSLRRMKSMIQTEVRRRGLENNIKLGAGGIREIEFIVQVFQLIRGGREPCLRRRGLIGTLDAIEELSLLKLGEVTILRTSYLFLRRLENLLQAMEDKQTQTLPDNEDDQIKLACAMGYEDWETLLKQTLEHMADVHTVFDALIGDDQHNDESDIERCYSELWDFANKADVVEQIIEQDIGLTQESGIAKDLIQFKQELAKKTLGPRGREVLNRLMPKVFQAVFSHPKGRFGFSRVLHLLQNIATRTTYLELLDEHPAALTQLVRLCTASPMISEQLARYPILLDELIDIKHLYNPIELDSYRNELRDYLARIPEDDMEQQMEGLRQFKQICILKIAAADVTDVLPVRRVSDHLTYLAEAIIEVVVKQAWIQLSEKHGEPTHIHQRDGLGFAVVGYGKLGGWELGYNSDLDIVFIHDCPSDVYTDGKKEIDGRQFYLRLAQRVVHLFSTRTPSGILYEIDTRLRPSGSSGLLVSSVEAFTDYQRNEAWTWEHQALVRTRMVFGDEPLQQAYSNMRHQILTTQRESRTLTQQVRDMRQKMLGHLGNKKPGRFMLKQDRGGITDIEFIAQYLVLRFSQTYPNLTHWSDNIRIFESLVQEQVITECEAQQLITAYTSMRNQFHRRNLLNLDGDVDETKFVNERQHVMDIWQSWLG
ncbi:bifunctional [glutamate--ammonia ligase]-adenylyl-L-tyrosine phosphorylase/[glutamate--ammonia-ligase] adenylyltransferase [Vibrio sp. WJH972]